MKLNYAIYSMLAFSMFAASCSQDEELTSNEPSAKQTISISVTDLGMTSADGTRAATDATTYATTFESGDAIGVFAVKDGSVVSGSSNIKLTYNGKSWSGSLASTYEDGTKFYAYYPYTKDLSGFDASKGFESVISSWDPTTKDSYAAGDLMTSGETSLEMTGVIGKLSFKLSHQMSMVELTNNTGTTTTYDFTNEGLDDYSISSSNEEITAVTFNSKTAKTTPVGSKVRALFSPATADLSISTASSTYKATSQTLEGGKYYTVTVGEGTTKTITDYTLEVGDIMLADGSLRKSSGNSYAISDAEKSSAIGVVYYVGDAAPYTLYNSSYNKYQSSDALYNLNNHAYTHGLVIAINDIDMASGSSAWGTTTTFSSTIYTDYYQKNLSVIAEWGSNYKARLLGYDNTATFRLIETNESKGYFTYLLSALDSYSTTAPTASSGWFVPSYGDIKLIADGILTNNKTSATGEGYITIDNTKVSSAFTTTLGKSAMWTSDAVYMTSSLEFNNKAATGKVHGYNGSAWSTYTVNETAHVIRPALAF